MEKKAPKTSRYLRHESVKEIASSHFILDKKTVAVIGLGGIGGMSAQLLARAGVGKIILVDKDKVEMINLHRQVLYKEFDVGKNKAVISAQKLRKMNSEISISAINMNIDDINIRRITGGKKIDLVLDCTDNLPARIAINSFCRKTKTPWIFASALGTKGMVCSVFGKSLQDDWFSKEFSGKIGFTACDVGILSTACNAVACIQVTEALKLLLGKKESSELIRIDIWKNEIQIITL